MIPFFTWEEINLCPCQWYNFSKVKSIERHEKDWFEFFPASFTAAHAFKETRWRSSVQVSLAHYIPSNLLLAVFDHKFFPSPIVKIAAL